jgi:PAS domain S-box-containing protein
VEYVARPLINQSKLIGILYLENNLASRVFTPARIAVLKLLASQAAISLENTRLYRDLAQREGKIRRLVDANIVGIFIGNLDGDIAEANEAFLRMLGYTREDLVSGRLRWTDLTPEELRERDQRAAAERRTTGTLQPHQKEFFRKDGMPVPVPVYAGFLETRPAWTKPARRFGGLFEMRNELLPWFLGCEPYSKRLPPKKNRSI